LSEARARLANTKGKKAKRKARERQLEESRRLSMLQKRRELKAAGVESKLVGVKKRKYIDYAREIPFQQLVPSGFYDVGDERVASKAITIDPRVQGLELSKMEGRHQKEEEDKEKQRDKKRLKTLFKANAPLAVMNLSENNDPSTLRRRSTLSLPAPQGDHFTLSPSPTSSPPPLPLSLLTFHSPFLPTLPSLLSHLRTLFYS
jgi:pre-mRNA-splicing factor CDC5/CEF1